MTDSIRRDWRPHEHVTTDGHVVRREVVDNTRDINVYRDGHAPGAGPPAHAPEFDQLSRELAQATGPSEGITDPMERAKSRLLNIERIRRLFLPQAGAEAFALEGHLRADRPAPAEPTITDEERMKRALDHSVAVTSSRSECRSMASRHAGRAPARASARAAGP